MLSWQDEAVILSAAPMSETSLRIHLLSRHHGRYAGVVRGGASRKKRAIFDMGNIVQANWRARVSEQMGSFSIELIAQPAATCLDDPLALAALNSAVALILQCIPERHPEEVLYQYVIRFLKHLHSGSQAYMQDYIALELCLIAATGFPVDLSRCAATGQTHDLCFVSPKSGRAVSRDRGKPYADKLFPLPDFLRTAPSQYASPSAIELEQALNICGYFLNHHAHEITHKPLPEARNMLLRQLTAQK